MKVLLSSFLFIFSISAFGLVVSPYQEGEYYIGNKKAKRDQIVLDLIQRFHKEYHSQFKAMDLDLCDLQIDQDYESRYFMAEFIFQIGMVLNPIFKDGYYDHADALLVRYRLPMKDGGSKDVVTNVVIARQVRQKDEYKEYPNYFYADYYVRRSTFEKDGERVWPQAFYIKVKYDLL